MEDGDDVDAKRASFSHVGMTEERQSAEEMDEKRQQAMAYEYLCHLQEAKQWMEACIREELPATTELEEGLMNGVILGKLAHFFAADIVPIKKLYDIDQSRYQAKGLHFRHTDNINHWLRAMEKVGFPKIFYPETTDIYDRKNMPRVIYCIHALSLFLFKLGIAPQIQDLYGKVNFTEEEITAMRKALEKYGIQMPAFNKIGGILANELSEDDAALHAAIIAINDAIEKQVSADTLTALQNPAARMKQVQDHLADSYQEQLYTMKTAKEEKAAAQAEREEVNEADQDVYDRLLTQAEIQGNVNQVNLRAGVDKVNAALDAGDEMALIEALQAPGLGLAAIKKDNATWYLDELSRLRQEKGQLLDKDDIHKSVEQANNAADTRTKRDEAIKAINMAIDSGSTTELMSALKRADAQLPPVEEHGTQLYLAGLTNLKNKKDGEGLVYEELNGAVEVLSAISGINRAVEAGDTRVILTALTNPKARVTGVEEHLVDRYTEKLNKAKGAKTVPGSKAAMGTDYLNPADVQSCVDHVNQEVQEEHDRIEAIATINDAIEAGDAETTLAALQIPAAKLADVEPRQAAHYQTLLMQGKKAKAEETNDDSAVLWLEEIQEGVNTANRQAVEAEKLAVGIASINLAIDDADPAKTLEALKNPDVFLHRVLPECAEPYQASLEQAKATKLEQGDDSGSSWVEHKTRQGHSYYFNLETMESSWLPPEGFSSSRTHLSREEIQAALNDVTNAHDRQEEFEAHEDDIIKLQAYTRGMLARRRYKERLDYFHQQLPAVVKIQSNYRGYQQRKKYQDRLSVLHGNPWAIVKIQAYAKMWRARRQYRQRLQYFNENVASVVKLQAFFRSNMARHDYHLLTHSDNPPLSVVRKFVHLLDPNDVDYNEELEVQKLRGQVVQDIRANQELENNLNLMDIKIGLLVKNRITLQDVITHGKKLKKRQQSTSGGTTMHEKGGLKALHKDSRHKLEMYQNLFYLLQTNPVYLAKLIFEMPTGRTTKFMESVILSLYNYAANAREEYLLLKLFKTALQEEINNKVDKMMEIVTGNPMVIKMVVTFNSKYVIPITRLHRAYSVRVRCKGDRKRRETLVQEVLRGTRGQSSLREIIQPLVLTIIKDKEMRINSNPIEVYKIWVNTMESKTGETSKLPYDVTTEQALQHPEVRERLEASISQLRNVTDKFLNTITSSAEKIPYGMRFMAKVLKDSLHEKFPDATEAEVLKIVGNLLYYRYMNPAIVAPDGFDIIDVNAGVGLSPDQRRNLGSIAKLLQFAASNKIFDGENAHLSSLNDYVSQAHEKFKKFFAAACDVPELEEKFNIDEYSDFTMLNKPVVYMSIKEICDTHKLLIDHQDALAPERQDPLHELLDDLGEAPKLEDLIGEIPLDEKDPNLEVERDKLAKTEVSLTLTNKFEVPEGDDTDMKALYTRTKRLIVDVIRVQPGDNLTDILSTPTTLDQEDEHQRLVKKREAQDEKSQKKGGLSRSQSAHGDNKLPVEAMKRKVLRHLRALEGVGLVSSTDNYQVMINDIAKDIRNQRRYRIRRRQELLKLKETTKALESKSQFYEEQIDYYNQYIKTCLDNLAKKKRRSKFLQGGKEDKPKKAKPPLKYTGARLHEKGVILEIDGLPPNQFKNVLFEIQETEDAGKFEVSAKFMGVAMEKVDLNLQDLLQLQYEGVSVMNMFDKAKVNVNLLIFLLNRKFYGK